MIREAEGRLEKSLRRAFYAMAKNLERKSWDELRAVILIRCKVNSEKKAIDWGRNNQRSISVVEVAFELGKSPCR